MILFILLYVIGHVMITSAVVSIHTFAPHDRGLSGL
jgi:hypothetical protein